MRNNTEGKYLFGSESVSFNNGHNVTVSQKSSMPSKTNAQNMNDKSAVTANFKLKATTHEEKKMIQDIKKIFK